MGKRKHKSTKRAKNKKKTKRVIRRIKAHTQTELANIDTAKRIHDQHKQLATPTVVAEYNAKPTKNSRWNPETNSVEMKCVECQVWKPRDTIHFTMNNKSFGDGTVTAWLARGRFGRHSLKNSHGRPCNKCYASQVLTNLASSPIA